MKPTREELALTIDEASWDMLRSHLERGGLVLVARELDLADAGKRLADDDAATVGEWIQSGKLTKPSAEQVVAWDTARDKPFHMLIISPYVLMQEK